MKHANVAFFIPHVGCPHQCSFCNQRSISGAGSPPTGEEVRGVLETAVIQMGERAKAAEIAFFGGSFTAVPWAYQEELLEAAYPFVKDGRFRGIRVSTRPDCVTPSTLERLKTYGVRAAELGAQSMADEVLRQNRRGHTARDVEAASGFIKAAGLELGLQMMTGLPGDTRELSRMTAEKLCDLQPQTVRIYPTVVLKGTELARLYLAREYLPQTLEEAAGQCAELLELFEGRGIRVIRLGLHSGGDVESGYLAGPYHPAFRELCESRIYLHSMERLLSRIPDRVVTFGVNPRELSKATGQKRENIKKLAALGREVRLRGDPTLKAYEVRQIKDGT